MKEHAPGDCRCDQTTVGDACLWHGPRAPVWWLSWIDDPEGPPGKRNCDVPVVTWISGWTGDGERPIYCARIAAPFEDSAWAALHIEYPGARDTERFSEEKPAGWWPPADRFPRKRGER